LQVDDGRTSGLPRLSHFVLGLLAGVAVRCEVPLPLRFSSSTLAAILGLPDVLASQVDDDQQRTCEVDHRRTHVSYPLAMLHPWASHLGMQAPPPPLPSWGWKCMVPFSMSYIRQHCKGLQLGKVVAEEGERGESGSWRLDG
jgi:hypothetical protein